MTGSWTQSTTGANCYRKQTDCPPPGLNCSSTCARRTRSISMLAESESSSPSATSFRVSSTSNAQSTASNKSTADSNASAGVSSVLLNPDTIKAIIEQTQNQAVELEDSRKSILNLKIQLE